LASYHRTALDGRAGRRDLFVFFDQAALFFCCLSLVSDNWLFYLTMAFWTGTNLCSLKYVNKPIHKKAPGTMFLPGSVRHCIRCLEKAGFEAYAVGGCVRDSLLDLNPSDYDLCTNATPEQIRKVFADYPLVRNGEKHGTIGVILEGGIYEITTFRTEGAYTDGRHPDSVSFVTDLEADLRRRDFTVNAMAMDLRGELGVLHQLGKQTIPVIANEALVRGFYFISRLIEEIKEKRALKGIDWKRTAPFKNATIIRMLTISTGTFTAIDTLDAVIEGAINSKANWVEFGRQTLLRLNFVGIGRFTISLGSEVVTSYKRGKKTKEQLKLQNECLYLLNAKMYHGEVLVWTAAKDADESIGAFYESLQKVFMQVSSDMEMTKENLNALKQLDVSAVEDKNPGLTDALLDALN
jgi:hypothetical protein